MELVARWYTSTGVLCTCRICERGRRAGVAVGATAIRAKRDELSIEAVEADVNPGGSALAAQEAVAAGEPAR